MDFIVTSEQRTAILVTFVLYTLVILAVAVLGKRLMDRVRIDNYVNAFYCGERGLGMVAVAFLLAASLCGAGTFVGGPGLAYKIGGVWLILCASQIFATFVVLGEIGKKVGIVARRINANSYMDLIAHRFNNNRTVLILGVVSIVVFMTANTTAQCIAGARVFETMTGLPYWSGLALFGLSVVLVTVLGGLRGVALATIVQGVAMTVAVVALIAGAHNEVQAVGGWESVSRQITQRDPSYFDLWKWPISYEFSQWIIYGFCAISLPHLTMGALTYKNVKAMKNAVWLGGLVVAFWTIGIVLYCTVAVKGLYPDLAHPDQAIPILTMKVLPTWLAGVTLAGVASAVQSTVAAMVLVVSSALVLNCYKVLGKKHREAAQMKRASLITTALVTAVVFILASDPPELLQWIVTFGMGGMAAAFFFTFLLGLYWPRANEYGAMAGMAGAFVLYIAGHYHLLPFDITMGMHPVAVSLLVSFVLTVVVSWLTPLPPKRIALVWFARHYPRQTETN